MEFIYLVPGNWFEIKNINNSKVQPYDISSFQAEVSNQIYSNADKLKFIELTFGNSGNKTMEDIVFHLDDEKFSNMINILKKEKRHPIITFHGTKLKSVNSILEGGYIIPQQNKNVVVAHGAAYGIGVYSSPFYDKAAYYVTTEADKYAYILVNMVFLGVTKLIPPSRQMTDFAAPINGCYADNSNTRIVYGLEQVISADPDRVVPIAVIKIKIG